MTEVESVTEELSVLCWCKARVVQATAREILNFKTRECKPGCKDIYDRIQKVKEKA